MMTMISKSNWKANSQKGKEYEVYDIHNQYYLIVDYMGRLVLDYSLNQSARLRKSTRRNLQLIGISYKI